MFDEVRFSGITPKDSYLLSKGTLAQGQSVTYNLRLWIKGEATNEVMGQYFMATIGNISYTSKYVTG